jgi:hypothetical protein
MSYQSSRPWYASADGIFEALQRVLAAWAFQASPAHRVADSSLALRRARQGGAATPGPEPRGELPRPDVVVRG